MVYSNSPVIAVILLLIVGVFADKMYAPVGRRLCFGISSMHGMEPYPGWSVNLLASYEHSPMSPFSYDIKILPITL